VVRLLEEIEDDAAQYGVPAGVTWTLAALPVVGGLLVAGTIMDRSLFDWILREDHPIEWLQLTLLMITAVMSLAAGVGFARRRQWLLASTFVLLCLGSVMLGGEEISWGQRAFALVTPGDLATRNDQGELNIHNLTGGDGGFDFADLFHLVELGIAAAGTLLPLLTRLGRPWLRVPLLRDASPPVFLVPAFAVPFAVRAARIGLALIGKDPDAAVEFTEWAELCLYFGLAGMAVFASVTTRRRPSGRHRPLDRDGRPAPPSAITLGVLSVTVVTLLVTLVLAVLTMRSGILPGNAA
jgi:hypothetical protein